MKKTRSGSKELNQTNSYKRNKYSQIKQKLQSKTCQKHLKWLTY